MSEKKKVLFIGSEYPPHGGGVGAYMKLMAEALVHAGHEVAVIACTVDDFPESVEEGGVHVYRLLSMETLHSSASLARVSNIVAEFQPDWIEGADLDGVCAPLFGTLTTIPFVIKVHGCSAIDVLRKSHVYYPWQKVMIALSRLRALRRSRDEALCLQSASLLAVPSAAMRTALLKQGIGRQDIYVLPNPFPVVSHPDPVDKEKATILFVGRLDIGKGIDYLPGLMQDVKKKIPDARLVVVGSDTYARGIGSLKQFLMKRWPKDSVDSVTLLGRKSDGRRTYWYPTLRNGARQIASTSVEETHHHTITDSG